MSFGESDVVQASKVIDGISSIEAAHVAAVGNNSNAFARAGGDKNAPVLAGLVSPKDFADLQPYDPELPAGIVPEGIRTAAAAIATDAASFARG